MKKVLSLILAIAMIATFIPAVSAAEGDLVDATGKMTIKYNFEQVPSGTTDTNVTSWYKFENTNGFFEHRATTCKPRVITNGIRLQRKTGKGEYSIFRVWLPEGGDYDVYVDWEAGKNVLFDFHIGPNGSVAKDPVVGTLSSVTSKARSNDKLSTNPITLSEGYNYVIFSIPEGFTVSGSDGYLVPYSISLVSTSADKRYSAPFIKEYTAPAAQIDANTGKTTMAISTATVLSDSVTEAGEVTVEYSSSNDNIAKVDSNGNITAGVDGTATITAKVTAENSNCYVTKTATVMVGTGEYINPNDITVKYNFQQVPSGTTDANVTSWYTFENTNGFFEHRATTCKPRVITNGIRLQRKTGKGEHSIFRMWVPKSGAYDVYVDWEAGKNVLFDFHIGPDGSVAKDPVVGTLSSVTSKARSNDKLSTNPITLSEGYNYVIFRVSDNFTSGGSSDGWLIPHSISLVAGSADAIMGGEMTAPEAPLAIGATDTVSAKGYLSSTGAAASFTYASDNESAVTVNSTTGAIEAVGAGSATITATCADALSGYNTVSKTITVAAPEAPKAPNVALYVTASKGDAVSVIVNGAEKDINTALSEKRGANVTVTANDYEGHTFRGWVRGSADRGVWVSSDPSYNFVAMTNTMLTAIYEENISGKAVEYYNENGEYIATKSVEDAAPSVPSLAGYTFNNKWFVSETEELDLASITAPLTRAVAKHTADTNAGTVTVNGSARSETTFNAPISLAASKPGFTAWKRDGKVVSYDSNYTYYIWSDTAIEESTEAVDEKLPIVILDADKVDGSWMVEYDSAGKTIAEVGIIFGNSADMDINSCMVKANSQRNSAHGQFAATSDYSAALGYIIYEDGGEYKVIYSE